MPLRLACVELVVRVEFVLVICIQLLQLNLNVDASGEVEAHQGINSLRRWIEDVDQTLVGAHFKMLTTVLVLMGRTNYSVRISLCG